MPFIRVKNPCVILGEKREEGDIVKDESVAECNNLERKGLVEFLTQEEADEEQAKLDQPAAEQPENPS